MENNTHSRSNKNPQLLQTRCTRNQTTASVILLGVPQSPKAHDNIQHNTTLSPPILNSFFAQSLFDKNVLSIVFQFVPVIERCACNNSKCLYMVYSTEFNEFNLQKWIFEVNQVFVVIDTVHAKNYAIVTDVKLTEIYVHYIGWSKKWDEWISKTSHRINAIYPSQTQFDRINNNIHYFHNRYQFLEEEMSIVKGAHKLFLESQKH
jgi:hypothetical protein